MTMAVEYSPTELVGRLICRSCGHVSETSPPHCPRCDTVDGLAAVVPWETWRDNRQLWMLRDEATRLLNVSAKVLVEYERLGVLHPQYVAFSNALVPAYDPKEIGKLPRYERGAASCAEPSYLVPGIITLLEFRVRYGYTCRRVPCSYCQGIHSRGMGLPRACKNGEGSGTRYHVRRAEGASVANELSAKLAWTAAYHHEQARLAPILIARDAIAEGRIGEAMTIAYQLDPDLAVPLRREIGDVIDDANSHERRT